MLCVVCVCVICCMIYAVCVMMCCMCVICCICLVMLLVLLLCVWAGELVPGPTAAAQSLASLINSSNDKFLIWLLGTDLCFFPARGRGGPGRKGYISIYIYIYIYIT